MTFGRHMKTFLAWTALLLGGINPATANVPPAAGLASLHDEDHRGKPMANGKRFNPDQPNQVIKD